MSISFIIPCYNVKKYLEKCVDSIVFQKFDNYEIIIVDDNSTDGTYELANSLAIYNPNIRVIKTPSSKGYAGQPRNIGIESAKGEYLAFIDPDDFYIGDNMKRSLETYGEYDMIVNSYIPVVHNPESGTYKAIGVKTKQCKEYDYKDHFHKAFNAICAQRMIFKRSLYIDNNIRYNEDLPSQDTIILFDIMKVKPRIMLTDILTTFYVSDRVGSVTNTYNFKKIQKGLKAIDVINQKIKESDYDVDQKAELDRLFSSWYLSCVKPFADEQIEDEIRKYDFKKYYRRPDGTSL